MADCARASLVLASASPRRHQLLTQLGLPFEVVAGSFNESEMAAGLEPETTARELAIAKALAVARDQNHGLVLGADTLIEFEGRVLGKPADPADALRMLGRLRNREHVVITGLCVAAAGGETHFVSSVRTHVVMANYSEAAVNDYVATGEPLDKAGSYAIQGLGAPLVARIAGCYNNVVGLPLCETANLLGRMTRRAVPDVCSLPDGRPCPRLPVRVS